MNVLIIDNGTRHLTELIQLFSGHKIKIVTREKLTDTNIQSDTLVVLSGAAPGNPGVLYSDGAYNTELELIKNHRGPIVGICLGMELIAHAYNMHLHRQKRRIRRLLAYSFTLKFAMERIMAKRYSSSY